MREKIKPHLLAIALYLLATIFFTWPLLPNILIAYPSSNYWYGGDPNVYIWYMDWIASGIKGLLPISAPLMLYYPQGINPLAGYEGPIMSLLGVPLILLTNQPVLAYNVVVLTALFATALATYALILYLTSSRFAAILGGLIFGFSPFALVRATQHLDLILLPAVPLLVLATLRFGIEPSLKRGVFLAAMVIFAAFSSWYYLLSGVLFIFLTFLYFRKSLLQKRMTSVVTCTLLTLAVVLPAIPILSSLTRGGSPPSFEFIFKASAQVPNFVLPHPFTSVFGQYTRKVYEYEFPSILYDEVPNEVESTSYFGIPMILLLLWTFLNRQKIEIKFSWLWVAAFLLFTILALGPQIRFKNVDIYLPFWALSKIFPFSLFRIPNRFFIFAYLAATVLLTFFLAYLKNAIWRRRFWLGSFTTLFLIILTAERLIYPYPLVEKRVSGFYQQLGSQQGNYAIVDLPIIYPGFSEYNFFQTIHRKPIVNGEFFYNAYSAETFSFIKSNPLLRSSICYSNLSPPKGYVDPETVFSDFQKTNIRFIVIHNFTLHDFTGCITARDSIRSFFAPYKSLFSDGEITVYAVPPRDRLGL